MPPPAPRLGSPEIFGYLPNWDLNATIDFGAITTIAYFGVGAGADGRLVRRTGSGSLTTEYSRWQGAKVRGIIDQAHAHGVKVVLTIERMAWSDGGKATTIALLSDPAARTTLVNEIVAEIVNRNIDGVSLDFEPLLSTQRDNFGALVRELRLALDAVNPMYQLTFATTGSQTTLNHELIGKLTMEGWADAVLIMAYPLRAIDHKYAGGLAPMYSPTSYDLKQILPGYLKRQTGDKIVLALPWYGRYYPTLTDQVNSLTHDDPQLYYRAHNIGYDNAASLASVHGRLLDPSEQSAWTVYRWRYCAECPETWRQVYYEDVDTLGFKYDWAAAQGLAGIGIWALGYDNARPELWKLLRLKYRGLVDTTAPSGSVAVVGSGDSCTSSTVELGFTVDDGPNGSGAVFARVSNAADVDKGVLVHGRTYPLPAQIDWLVDGVATGGVPATGPQLVYVQWRDVAGNWSPVVTTQVDVPGPATAQLSLTHASSYAASNLVNVAVTQTGGRQISRVLLSASPTVGADGTLAQSVEGLPDVPISISLTDPSLGASADDGPRDIYAQWQDSAGCWSTPESLPVVLDRAAPSGSLSIVGAPTTVVTRSVQLLAPAVDATSGVAYVDLSNDGVTWTKLEPSEAPLAWSAGARADGPWTIRARWQDRAGNWSAIASVSVKLDTSGPVGSLVLDGGAKATTAGFVSVQAVASDAASEVVELLLSNSPTQTNGVLAGASSFAPGSVAAWPLAGAATSVGVADGVHRVYAQWRDAAGHWSSIASASIIVDTTAPAITAPTLDLVKGGRLQSTSVPVRVAWVAQDGGTGVARQSLRLLPVSGTPTSSSLYVEAATPPVTGTIGRGTPWIARVQATDLLGNTSTSVDSVAVVGRVQEEAPTAVTYRGTWRKVSNTSSSGGSTRYSTARRATASWRFTGRSVAWVAPTGPRMGKAKVFVDGVLVTTVDLRSSAKVHRNLVFVARWATSGTHTIKIKVLGTSGRPRVDIDAFVALS